MALSKLRVLARGDTLVLDAAYARTSGRLRFVGRTLIEADSADQLPAGCPVRERDPVDAGDKFYVEGWPRGSAPVEVPAVGEFGSYFRSTIREGGLWPADAETAEHCGVAFDPTFGGEYPDLAPKTPARAVKAGE